MRWAPRNEVTSARSKRNTDAAGGFFGNLWSYRVSKIDSDKSIGCAFTTIYVGNVLLAPLPWEVCQ
jgi:hypothetical protein